MEAKKQALRMGQQAKIWRENPYLRRIAEDEELRGSMVEAYESLRDAYTRLSAEKRPARAIFGDKKLHKNLKRAVSSIQDAGSTMTEPTKKRRPVMKLALLTIVGGVAALVVSEGLRNKVLDLLFGAEEKFEYTSPTTASSPSDSNGSST